MNEEDIQSKIEKSRATDEEVALATKKGIEQLKDVLHALAKR